MLVLILFEPTTTLELNTSAVKTQSAASQQTTFRPTGRRSVSSSGGVINHLVPDSSSLERSHLGSVSLCLSSSVLRGKPLLLLLGLSCHWELHRQIMELKGQRREKD
ncbi:unnamed protein product [Pleuronectes platessa]|uniref:Uncharacterized protein n=1 Tax=Pleuronectes platessa TaxID=8262 RepID=A0A9N7Y5T4_PLEPL|nr:unnamed protein product [Pleuronectes platessa]